MPAGSDPGDEGTGSPAALPALPVRFRPLGVRFAGYLCGGLLLLVLVVVWFAFPPETRDRFTAFQLATIAALTLAAMTCGYALTRSRVDAVAEGLVVVNGFKRRDLAWNQVLAVSLKPGGPWVILDLSDGTSVPAMGIQGSDGARAHRKVRQLRALLEANSKTSRND